MASLSVVIPHWPLDEETNEALRRCVSSFPDECEKLVVVNDGTGYAHNVNIGLRLATGDFVAAVNNDCRLKDGNVFDLCIADAVTSPLIIGERQGIGQSIEPGGFHGCFWVAPKLVLDRVGLLDERFEWAYWEDDDFIARVHDAGFATLQVASVLVKHVGGLTTVKIPEHRNWLELNARRFEEKWGRVPPEIPRYRRVRGSGTWHFCQNCQTWPSGDYDEAPTIPSGGAECDECRSLRARKECAFY